jgi:hypothetical protein
VHSDPSPEHIRDALRGLKYGSVLIVIEDGVIVQVDRTERRRLRESSPRHISWPDSVAGNVAKSCSTRRV